MRRTKLGLFLNAFIDVIGAALSVLRKALEFDVT